MWERYVKITLKSLSTFSKQLAFSRACWILDFSATFSSFSSNIHKFIIQLCSFSPCRLISQLFNFLLLLISKASQGASLVAHWLRISLPMQGTQVRALVWEDPTCHGATKPMHHNCWACAIEPGGPTTEARKPRVPAPQQEKPLQREARTPQRRVAPARRN